MASADKAIRVGSRKSQLALIQTKTVIDQLKLRFPNLTFEVVTMTTTGDNILDTALSKIGEKSLFTKELETGLLSNQVDFVVHSLKDLPTELPPGLVIGAVCKRDDPRDALLVRADLTYTDLASLPPDSVVGTSSLRRAAQLRRKYPHLQISDIRGNLNTRLRKLDESGSIYSAIVLAVAGIHRMQWDNRISHILPPEECMYAVGQGAMAVECRSDDVTVLNMLSQLSHRDTLLQCVAERSFLRKLEGGCSVPVAVNSVVTNNTLTLYGGVFSISGEEGVTDSLCTELITKEPAESIESSWWNKSYAAIVTHPSVALADTLAKAETLGTSLAEKLLQSGADGILTIAKDETAKEILRQKADREANRAKNANSCA